MPPPGFSNALPEVQPKPTEEKPASGAAAEHQAAVGAPVGIPRYLQGANDGGWRASGNLRGYPPVRPGRPPNIAVIEDEQTYQGRLNVANKSLQAQRSRAEQMAPGGTVRDPRFWFAKVYSFVTENELDDVVRKTFYYPSYVLQSVRFFEQIYADNLAAADFGRQVEEHWLTAFQESRRGLGSDGAAAIGVGTVGGGSAGAALGAGGGALISGIGAVPGTVGGGVIGGGLGAAAAARVYPKLRALVVSMKAHIRYDLPRAEAWVYENFYSSMPGVRIADFSNDFLSMGGIFDRAGEAMMPIIAHHATVPLTLMPRLLQDFGMTHVMGADMATERNDTWRRAEALVASGRGGAGPYKDSGRYLAGTVQDQDHLSGIKGLPDARLRPSMANAVPQISDSAIRADVASAGEANLSRRPASERTAMLRRLQLGITAGGDERAILSLLYASRLAGDVVKVIDGANAWDLMYATDGAAAIELRQIFWHSYYAHTSPDTAFTTICRCMDGETARWEGQMITDILDARHTTDGKEIIERIGQKYKLRGDTDLKRGLNKLEWQLDGDRQRRLTELYGGSGKWW